MESLGRLNNVIPVAAGAAFKMRGASVAQIVCTIASGSDTFTVSEADNFAMDGSATLNCIKNIYWATALDGTEAWNKFTWAGGTPLDAITLNASSTGTPSALSDAKVGVFHIFTSQLSDPNDYLQVNVGGSGLVAVILGDLVSQRNPANLEVLGS
jgi:hypothetical protein